MNALLQLVPCGGDAGVERLLDDVTHEHLEHLRRRNLAAGTIQQREYTLLRFWKYAGVPPIEATTGDILAFIDRRQRDGSPLGPQSIAAELAHLRGFYKWAVIYDLRIDDPTIKVERPKLPRRLPRPIPEDDLARAIRDAPERVRPMLYLAAYAGLRACEIAGLRAEHLLWHADPPLIFIARGKGGDEQAVPLAPVLEPVLRSLPRRGWLFPYQDGKLGPVKAHNVSHLCNDYLHREGITHTLHSLRHRFGTQVYRLSGKDLRQTQELMRHATPVSTAIYTALVQGEAAGIVSALPSAAAG